MDPTIQKLAYLDAAAHILSLSSPPTAAAFQARYDHVANENGMDPPATRARQICCACGHNMLSTSQYTAIPQGKSGKRGTRRSRKEETKDDVPTQDKTIVLECSACLSKTTVGLPAAKRLKTTPGRTIHTTSASMRPIPIPNPSRAASSQPQLSTQNGRAKAKRAKNRNSLHAMLAKSKEEAQSGRGFGFGLMDLMKSA
ncbi:hypothetical protein Vi05172_g4427 [Venturia inaequalis]|nr:hypothetical protein Vi05172_g4427 [Venturia inaequalis]